MDIGYRKNQVCLKSKIKLLFQIIEIINNFIDTTYFPARSAAINYKKVKIGKIGVLHPTVVAAFELSTPCSVMEINIEPFV